MTTLAWDGKTLAADRCTWSGPARRATRKVFKVTAPDGRKYLIGFCGDGSFAIAVLDWMNGKADRPKHSDFGVNPENQFALVIDEQHRVWNLTANLNYLPYREKIFAMGGGQEFAWGALEAGATAKQAVTIAIKRSDYAGMGVDCISFD